MRTSRHILRIIAAVLVSIFIAPCDTESTGLEPDEPLPMNIPLQSLEESASNNDKAVRRIPFRCGLRPVSAGRDCCWNACHEQLRRNALPRQASDGTYFTNSGLPVESSDSAGHQLLILFISIGGTVLVMLFTPMFLQYIHARRTAPVRPLPGPTPTRGTESSIPAALRDDTHEAASMNDQSSFSRRLLAIQEAERQRIATDLHDCLAQKLIVIQHRTQLALQKDDADPDYLLDQLQDISETALDALREVRSITHELRPPLLEQNGLAGTIEDMVEELDLVTGIHWTSVIGIPEHSLEPDSQIVLYRIIQESVTNILRHSCASHASVTLKLQGHGILLVIEDDGIGFDVDAALRKAGLGMRSMHERVQLIRGRFHIDSRIGVGTVIRVTIPV